MKTMYKAYTTSTDGYTYTKHELTNGYVATFEEAKEATKNVKHGCFETGDWMIEATTIDEETFTVKTETLARYNWYDEVGQWKHYKEEIELHTKLLEEAKAIKAKTEKGEQRKQSKIARELREIEWYQIQMARKGL